MQEIRGIKKFTKCEHYHLIEWTSDCLPIHFAIHEERKSDLGAFSGWQLGCRPIDETGWLFWNESFEMSPVSLNAPVMMYGTVAHISETSTRTGCIVWGINLESRGRHLVLWLWNRNSPMSSGWHWPDEPDLREQEGFYEIIIGHDLMRRRPAIIVD
jgi:hypothetical protein